MRIRILAILLVAAAAGVLAQETVTLTTPETVVSNLRYRVERFSFDVDNPDTAADEGRLLIQLMGIERAVAVSCLYSSTTTPTATTLITGLNKANLSSAYNNNATTGSLKQRIYHRLVVIGEAGAVCGRSLAGTLTGSVP